MMFRSISIASIVLAGLAFVVPARADNTLTDNCITRFCHTVLRDTKRNNCWPKPFVCPDRYAVRAPFVAMVAKGWERQNTLDNHHFKPGSGELTHAGILKVRWILIEGPPRHRAIFVHRALDPAETAARMDAVVQLAIRVVPEGELPPVLETNIPAPGCPAEYTDTVARKYQATIPDPRLPCVNEDTSGN